MSVFNLLCQPSWITFFWADKHRFLLQSFYFSELRNIFSYTKPFITQMSLWNKHLQIQQNIFPLCLIVSLNYCRIRLFPLHIVLPCATFSRALCQQRNNGEGQRKDTASSRIFFQSGALPGMKMDKISASLFICSLDVPSSTGCKASVVWDFPWGQLWGWVDENLLCNAAQKQEEHRDHKGSSCPCSHGLLFSMVFREEL